MKYKNLLLVGTSHIAKQSLNEVEQILRENKPDILGLELDVKRLRAMLAQKQRKITLGDIRRVGIKGYIFALLGGWAEKKLGESVGVSPGAEMLRAVRIAKELQIPIALIDQDIEITLSRLSKAINWREKWNFIKDILKNLITRKKEFDFDLTKVPSQKLIDSLTQKVKKRYPNIYKVLVTERNEIMAKRLAFIMDSKPDKNIVAIVGAGHEKEIISLIKSYLKVKKSL